MSQERDNSWIPPVSFYFRVAFQWGNHETHGSFMEVSGLDEEIAVKQIQALGDDGGQTLVTGEIKHTNITLKRPLESLSGELASWVKECFSFMIGENKIRPCLLIISLLDANENPYASWVCTQAFPIKWSLSPMNAQESQLSIETLTLTFKTLERKN